MTTWTVQPSGGDYTTLASALSNASTVASDIIEISGDWTSTTDTASGTAADANLIIRTKVSDQARHAGVDNAGTNYELAVTDGATAAIEVTASGVTIDGLLVLQNATGTSDECIRMSNTGGTLTVVNTIVRAANNSSDQDGVYAGTINCTINCENVCAIGFGRAGFQAQNSGGAAKTHTWNLISCTAWNCGRFSGEADGGGINSQSKASSSVNNLNLHNCAFLSNTSASSDDYNLSALSNSGTNNWNIDNCISSDQSIDSGTGGGGRDSAPVNAMEGYVIGESDTSDAQGDMLVNDITTAPYDLRLVDSANNDAQDAHTAATGAGLTIGDYTTGDVAGTTRPQNTSHDVGFFEVVAGGVSSTTNVSAPQVLTLVPQGPTIVANQQIDVDVSSPAVLTLSLPGPTVQAGASVFAAAPQAILLSPQGPTIAQGGNIVSVSDPLGILLQTLDPTILSGVTVSGTTATVIIQPQGPAVQGGAAIFVDGPLSMVMQPQGPTLRTGVSVIVEDPVGLLLSPQGPTVRTGASVAVDTQGITITAPGPAIQASSVVGAEVGTPVVLRLLPLGPTISAGVTGARRYSVHRGPGTSFSRGVRDHAYDVGAESVSVNSEDSE
jgi:hypothetical protein